MKWPPSVLVPCVIAATCFAQTEGARVSGRVTDLSGAVIVGAECTVTDIDTNVSTSTTTNEDGIYVIPALHPAVYRLTIEKAGFRTVFQPSLELYAQDAVNENFTLAVGLRSDSVTVNSNDFGLQTESAAVSTVVNQQFVDNMPLNGRSFQSLISVAPGVVFTSAQFDGPGQFSVNGQRSDANYFTVDGVSANFGVQVGQLSQSLGGAIPAFTSQGGTNGFVSVDDMQEFRIQTSSYEAEFGRTPGAQISIVTKAGANKWHGSAFDYLRNDIFDARNYFDTPPLPKPPLRQNDFGGTFGGPIIKDKTFFFFSYEGLRLRLPQTASEQFYTASARAAVAPAYQPTINALPLPDPNAPLIDPSCDNITNPCQANIVAAYSDPSSLDATSIRIDHNLTKKINLFARYSHAPSYDATRNWEEVETSSVGMDTLTAGATILLTPAMLNDFRANWSRNTASNTNSLTDFHGAVVPPLAALFPPSSPYTPGTGQALVFFPDGEDMEVRQGRLYDNSEKQLNFVDTLSWAFRTHLFKFGLDYRRLTPTAGQDRGYAFFPSAFALLRAGTIDSALLSAGDPFSVSVNNYSLFAQDTWKITSQLTLNYGLRWEINTPPVSASSQPLYATQGIFDSNPLAVVPGTLWHTRFNNFAPRVGAAYRITPKTVIRGAFGVFYDLGYGSFGDTSAFFPYHRSSFVSLSSPVPFNLTNPAFQPPPFSTTIGKNVLYLVAVDPNLRLPLTLQWNAAIQRELGANQTLSATYVGADDTRLLREDIIRPPLIVSIGNGGAVYAVRNAGYSRYNALQIQFQSHMSHGLQALISYNLAKTSDLGSSDGSGVTAGSVSQVVLPPLTPSDFDIRNSIAGAVSYELPAPAWGRISNAILRGWAVDGLVRVSSAPPINITELVISPTVGAYRTQAQIVPGQPFWIPDSTQPSGTALNPAAFTTPPVGQVGDFPRNSLRSPYSIDQTDVALRRRFKLTDRLNLSVRAEYFNVFNHPMFGAPGSDEPGSIFDTSFGKIGPGSTTNLLLGGGAALGGQSPLYALGGPRSAQFTIKLQF
jgi:Carboxypeptidase regulatory-like domain/TonB dependent receptor/TonB-dependent Receptor Plug Domain